MVSEDTWLNENSKTKTKTKTNILILALCHFMLDQLKRFNESVIDPECLLKIVATSFCLAIFYTFQATLYFLVYYLRSMVYVLSKMVWNYNQC